MDSLLDAEHRGHTRFRFSINTREVARRYERGTPPPSERLAAAGKVARAGYPLGLMIAPVLIYPGWESDYRELLKEAREALPAAGQRPTS